MIVVDSLALSKMISNDIVLPFVLRDRRFEEVYWASLNSTRLGDPGRGDARLHVGAHGGGTAPARGDGPALVHRGHAVRAGGAARSLLASRHPQGRVRGHLVRVRAVVLYAHPARARQGRHRPSHAAGARPARRVLAEPGCALRSRRVRRPEPRRVLVAVLQPRRIRPRLGAHHPGRGRAEPGRRLRRRRGERAEPDAGRAVGVRARAADPSLSSGRGGRRDPR